MVSEEQLQGGEVPFGSCIVDGQGPRLCGQGGICTVSQEPVHDLRVAEAGSQMQNCGTRIVSVLWGGEAGQSPLPVPPSSIPTFSAPSWRAAREGQRWVSSPNHPTFLSAPSAPPMARRQLWIPAEPGQAFKICQFVGVQARPSGATMPAQQAPRWCLKE